MMHLHFLPPLCKWYQHLNQEWNQHVAYVFNQSQSCVGWNGSMACQHSLHCELNSFTIQFGGGPVHLRTGAGVPARVRTHEVTKQVEYIGDVQNLVEKLSDLPAGGQILMGPLTYQRIYGRLEEFQIHSLQLAYEQPSRAPGHVRGARARRRMSGALFSMCNAVKQFGRSGSASFTSRKTSASSMHDAEFPNHYDHHMDAEVSNP